MATFREGQRVRVRVSCWGYAGREATIVGPGELGYSPDLGSYFGYPVAIDGVGCFNPCGGSMVARPDWIEPLQPERNQLVAWEDVPGGRPETTETV